MPRGRRNRPRPREHRTHEPESTPETRAKLQPDPLQMLLAGRDVSLERAADEIRDVYLAVCRMLMARGNDLHRRHQGKAEMPAELAWAHKHTYLPWVAHWSGVGTRGQLVDRILRLVVEREAVQIDGITLYALADYAKRMRERPDMDGARANDFS